MIQSDIYDRCVMTLIQGVNSSFPCPVCLVAGEGMCKGTMGTLRTTESMKAIYQEAVRADSSESREDLLRGYGLRFIEVC
jgi:hypothetical protein